MRDVERGERRDGLPIEAQRFVGRILDYRHVEFTPQIEDGRTLGPGQRLTGRVREVGNDVGHRDAAAVRRGRGAVTFGRCAGAKEQVVRGS